MMKNYQLLLTLIFMLIGFSVHAQSEKVFVVVHKDNNDIIGHETIKNIYLDNMSYWNSGEPIIVFELPVSSMVRENFTKFVLNKNAMSSQRDWSNRFVNNTLKNDVKVKPQKLAARFIGVKKNAIGYVSESVYNKSNNLKIVLVIE